MIESKLDLFQEWFNRVAEKDFEIRSSECLDRRKLLKTLISFVYLTQRSCFYLKSLISGLKV